MDGSHNNGVPLPVWSKQSPAIASLEAQLHHPWRHENKSALTHQHEEWKQNKTLWLSYIPVADQK